MTPTYQGDRANEPTSNNWPNRDLSLINQPAGGIEFVNTKDDEMLTLYYKNGSLLRFHKFGSDTLHTLDKREHIQGDCRIEINGNVVEVFDKDIETINLGDSYEKVGDVDKWQTYTDQYKELIRPIHDKKRLFELQRTENYNSIDQSPMQNQSGSFVACPLEATQSTLLFTTSPTIYVPGTKDPCNITLPTITDLQTAYNTVTNNSQFCPTCGGTHLSPSSQDGNWTIDSIKNTISQDKIDVQTQLFEIEKHLGQNKCRQGGTKIQKIAKDFVQVIGLTFNDLESFRIDPIGKLVPCAVKIDPLGGYFQTQYRPSSLVEHVNVERFPGGAYDITAMDSYSLIVGSNGINTKTTGPWEIYSPLLSIASESLIISSRAEVSIDCQRFDINADIISFRPRNTQRSGFIPDQGVMIDGNLGVNSNLIVRGGTHISGELTVNHITAPLEYQISDESFEWGPFTTVTTDGPCGPINVTTNANNGGNCVVQEKVPVRADMLEGYLIGFADCSQCDDGCIPVYSVCSPSCIEVHPLRVQFKNLPLKLIRDNTELQTTVNGTQASATLDPNSTIRAIGSCCNYPQPVQPQPVLNSITENTVIEKFGGSCGNPLIINEGQWQTSNIFDTLPQGQGIRTTSTNDATIQAKIKGLEALLEQTYSTIQQQIASLTSQVNQ